MRLILALILLANSYVAVGGVTPSVYETSGSDFTALEALINQEPEVLAVEDDCARANKLERGPANAAQCTTASQLMSLNLNNGDFNRICRRIVQDDPGCKKLKPEKRMRCSSKRENQILSGADLGNKLFQCAKGMIWDSMYDLGKFIFELIKIYVKGQVNSVTGMVRFLTDSSFRQRTIAQASSAAHAGSRLGRAFLNQSMAYVARELPRNMARHPFNPLMAVGKTLLNPLINFITESVQQMAAHYVPQYQCMNGAAKLYTFCRIFGEFVMPPAFLFAYLKFGVRGLQTLARTQAAKIGRVRARFAQANEGVVAAVREAPRPAPRVRQQTPPPRQDRIVADQRLRSRPRSQRPPRPAPAPARTVAEQAQRHPPRPAPAAPLARPIEEHHADELIEVARSERAEAAIVEAPPVTSIDEYKAVIDEVSETQKVAATEAIESLARSGASPGIVVSMYRKYASRFTPEVARTPSGTENLWSKLSRYIQREKAAGKSDEVIQSQVDDAFKCN